MTLTDLEMASGMIRKRDASLKEICALAFQGLLARKHASTDAGFAEAFLKETFRLMAAAGFHQSYAEDSFRDINQHFKELLKSLGPAVSATRNFRKEIANSGQGTQEVIEACLIGAARTCLQWCIFLRAEAPSMRKPCFRMRRPRATT